MEVQKKRNMKCTYENCNAAYVRQDNLKQHIAVQHTHVFLYKCKKCDKQFHTSPEATAHRKNCYPVIPDKEHTRDETDPKEVEDPNKEVQEKEDENE